MKKRTGPCRGAGVAPALSRAGGTPAPQAWHCIVLLAILAVAGCNRGDVHTAAGTTPVTPAAETAAAPKTVVTKTGIEMVLISAGRFLMGDDNGEDDERPAHEVQLGAFYMDTGEVTQAAYEKLVGRNPAKFTGFDRPVERISWVAAVQYCNMRSLREGLKPCYDPQTQRCDFAANGYRLPTEAEWEYACRAGTTTRWSCGDDAGELGKQAWFKGNAAKTTHPVKQKAANRWGLYDMHGNVAEWCHDFYADHYEKGPATDPRGPASGDERVLRGGSWSTSEDGCRSSARKGQTPAFADACFGSEAYGFRCVRKVDQ